MSFMTMMMIPPRRSGSAIGLGLLAARVKAAARLLVFARHNLHDAGKPG
jgi:hypothetical protein